METLLRARAALLQSLAIPGYGVELITRVRRATKGNVRLKMGSVYPTLFRLERDGLVRSELVRPARGVGRPRRYYELTRAGVARVDAEREALRGLLRMSIPEGAPLVGPMSERVRECVQLSRSLRRLRRAMLATQRRS